MRTIKRVYDGTLNHDWIVAVIKKAAKGKKRRAEVQKVLADVDRYADVILGMLKSGDFKLRPVSHRTITEKGKTRALTISPFFPNRILDYIIVETLKPYIRRSMYPYCVGNVDGRGISYGVKAVKRNYKQYKYYVKLDIRKYYPSVTSENLMAFLERKIADRRFLRLCRAVILQVPDLPIGSYYSQWFSNWYLEDVDHYVKERLRVPFYVRYVDDMLLMGNNKRKLLCAEYNIDRKLAEKGLSLKRVEQVKQWSVTPIDFLGFRFGEAVRMRRVIFHRLTRLLRNIRKAAYVALSQARALLAYVGWLRYIDGGYGFYINRVKPVAPKGALRRKISNYDRRINLCLH